MSGPILEGILAINKPPAISSAQVIRDVQNHFNPSKLFQPWLERERSKLEGEAHNQRQKRKIKGRKLRDVKMGHGGTLDPMATGVLILGLGSGTKDLQFFTTECTKSYEAVVLFGAATDTYDTEGKIVGWKSYDHITRDKVEEALGPFRGKGMQKPPIFSALRVQGKRLYEYAREGIPLPDGFEIKERPVDVMQLEIMEWYPGGTHEWHWPTSEADSAEKDLARQALPDQLGDTCSGPNARSEESSGAVLKRKISGVLESTIGPVGASSPKRTKADQDETAVLPFGRLPVQDGAQSDTETAEPLKDDQQLASSSAAVELPQQSEANTSACPAPACRIKMTVTSGFYVRSLIHDLGAAVDSLACMSSLVRTRQSDFELGTNVLQYDELKAGEHVWGPKVQKLLEEWIERKSKQVHAPDKVPNADAGVTPKEMKKESEDGESSDRNPTDAQRIKMLQKAGLL